MDKSFTLGNLTTCSGFVKHELIQFIDGDENLYPYHSIMGIIRVMKDLLNHIY